jgi:hypothetical protein
MAGRTLTAAVFKQLNVRSADDSIKIIGRVNLPGRAGRTASHGLGIDTATGDLVHVVTDMQWWPDDHPIWAGRLRLADAPLIILGSFKIDATEERAAA